MAHTHPNVTITSSTTSHRHTVLTEDVDCDAVGEFHYHSVSDNPADSHSHLNVVLAFGEAALGSPNWWQHRHPITLVSMDSAGGSHTHTFPSVVGPADCEVCAALGTHTHGIGTAAEGSAGAAHTHTLGTVYTDYADPSGTPGNHVHPFNVTLDAGGSHAHTVSGSTSLNNCAGGKSHSHNYHSPSLSAGHTHTLSGNSGAGGEILINITFEDEGVGIDSFESTVTRVELTLDDEAVGADALTFGMLVGLFDEGAGEDSFEAAVLYYEKVFEDEGVGIDSFESTVTRVELTLDDEGVALDEVNLPYKEVLFEDEAAATDEFIKQDVTFGFLMEKMNSLLQFVFQMMPLMVMVGMVKAVRGIAKPKVKAEKKLAELPKGLPPRK